MVSPQAGITLTVADEVVERHPDILVAGMLVSGLRAAVPRLADDPEPDVRQELSDRGLRMETLADEPVIADWRAAIAACGLKPSTYKSSPEQLARRTLKSGPVRTGLPMVDVYCDVATRHLAPLGAYDVERLPAADVRMRLANPERDRFAPLGGREGDMPLDHEIVVYACGNTVICWAFNCRDSRDTCLVDETDAALFVGEAVTTRQHGPLRAALTELAGRLQRAGAAVSPILSVDATEPSAQLPAA